MIRIFLVHHISKFNKAISYYHEFISRNNFDRKLSNFKLNNFSIFRIVKKLTVKLTIFNIGYFCLFFFFLEWVSL